MSRPLTKEEFEQIFDYDEQAVRASIAKTQKMIMLSPYKELKGGKESIHDHINPDQIVPAEVVEYLKHGEPDWICMGIYNHPFVEGKRLCGPYRYNDGVYRWDRDLWLYVSKYHVELPQDFIEHVFSEYGRNWMEEHKDEQFGKGHANLDKTLAGPGINLTPENDGNITE